MHALHMWARKTWALRPSLIWLAAVAVFIISLAWAVPRIGVLGGLAVAGVLAGCVLATCLNHLSD